MKKYITIITLVFGICYLIGCSKKEVIVPTQAELTTNELKTIINDSSIVRMYPVKYNDVFPNSFPASGGTSWSFSNGFVFFNYDTIIRHYNLNYLVAYTVTNIILDSGATTRALILYFK